MSKTFEKAPLVEIVAEMRWNPQLIGRQDASSVMLAMNSSEFDEFFMRFGGEVYQQGFQLAERLIPPGFPMVLSQPVYRFRQSTGVSTPVLYQVGVGLFSANAIPPYKSWDTFSPMVEVGVDALLKTRTETERDTPFSSVSLRYINAFGPPLTERRDVGAFLSDVLNIHVSLPAGLTKHIQTGKRPKPSLKFFLPLEEQLTMIISVGEGTVNNESAIVMDTTVATIVDVPADKAAIMRAFNLAQDVIHSVFFDLTKPIEKLMQPIN